MMDPGKMTFDDVLAENKRRHDRAAELSRCPDFGAPGDPIDIVRARDDFEYWAARAVIIRDKVTGNLVPFRLNRAQRRVTATLETMRRADKPIRLIMLKARQWGGSTLVQMYMAWIQMMHRRNWHSAICAHVNDASRTIRGMYSTMLEHYPAELVDDDCPAPTFVGFEGARNVRLITGRDCRVSIMSAECQDSVRGSDIAMIHLSEVAFWKATEMHDPEDVLRSVGAVFPGPMTLVAIESTANGVGNFFHTEWLRAEAGLSDKVPIFVPWYEIDMYTMAVDDPRELWNTLTPYERDLWHVHGCTLEQIAWYRYKLREYPKPELMHAEFPTTPLEAFVSSGANVFANDKIEALRAGTRPPLRVGEIGPSGVFTDDTCGCLQLWAEPVAGEDYVAAVDIGGRSLGADWSVIAVLRCSDRPEVVAQWRGHADHDLLGDTAMAVAAYFNDALLVIESNTLETEDNSPESVLERVARCYPNVYYRRRSELDNSQGIGFHTNRSTKPRIIDNLIAMVREGGYIERDSAACDELATYCRLPNGSYAARRGRHDDMLMTRAIALYVMNNNADNIPAPDLPPLPQW